ncbi:hypothetical protein V6N12_057899 [Hibiscus sabdariffa]|uniref:Uncharacterized protein n=1 Tax=Hibiscus sabdariffa TaxID=183260 RepID=A0ABR2B3X7_9ROSI
MRRYSPQYYSPPRIAMEKLPPGLENFDSLSRELCLLGMFIFPKVTIQGLVCILSVETWKRPEVMHHKARIRGTSDYGGRSSYYGLIHNPLCDLLTILRVLEAATAQGDGWIR